MKALFIHAHFDDYEFTAAGTFELWRRRLGQEFQGKVIVCTDGAAGHHFRTREETARLRLAEQLNSVRLGGYEFELLSLPDGRVSREVGLRVTPDFLAALWKAIREFEPDYLFCPPLPADPLAGVHPDHLTVAQAVREVGYLINVPHAFTPEYPADETQSAPCRTPVIIAVYDGYMFGENAFDLAVDVEPAFDVIADMSWCHQSQITEWLPWVGRHQMDVPRNLADWRATLRRRFDRKSREVGLASAHAMELFTVTAWGEVPAFEALSRDLPGLCADATRQERLRAKLARWRGAE
jgi:LmbE family N-acetylglucosaminyl deacetylase